MLLRWGSLWMAALLSVGSLTAQNPSVLTVGSYNLTFSFQQHGTTPTLWRMKISATSDTWPGWINVSAGNANGLPDINVWGAAGGNSFDTNNRADKYSGYFEPIDTSYTWTVSATQSAPSAGPGSTTVTLATPVVKSVTAQLANNDDRAWSLTFPGELGDRFTTVNAGGTGSIVLEEVELPDSPVYGFVVGTRKMSELYKDGEWFLAGGQFRDPKDPVNDIYTYEVRYRWGPVGKGDAKNPSNVVTITIPLHTARDMPAAGLLIDNNDWVIPEPSEEVPQPKAPSQPDDRNNPLRPTAELAKAVLNKLHQTIDPATGETRLPGYFGPIVRDNNPTTDDGKAIVETLEKMQDRAEKMHQLGTLQGEDAATVAAGVLAAAQAGKAAVEGDGTGGLGGGHGSGGMGDQGAGAGEEAAALFGDAPTGLPYTVGSGTKPDLTVEMPAAFGGGTFDFDPFRGDRMGVIAAWFRSALAWLAIVILGAWVWSQLGEWVRGISTLPQARGNAVIGGAGAQATALVAAGLMTTAIVVAITAILSWSFGELTIPSLISTALSNPVSAMPAGVLWMLDQIFPVGTLVVCLCARLSFNIYAAGLFASCAAVIRFIVP